MKRCTKCFAEKATSEFNRDCTRPDKLYPQCKECTRANCRRVYRKYEEKHLALKQRWKDQNRERHREINREWGAANPDEVRAKTARYRQRLARATPPWVDQEALRAVYDARPDGYHVDHIFPLAGKTVCGLNVPWNLQYLPAEQHARKGVKLPVSAGGCANL